MFYVGNLIDETRWRELTSELLSLVEQDVVLCLHWSPPSNINFGGDVSCDRLYCIAESLDYNGTSSRIMIDSHGVRDVCHEDLHRCRGLVIRITNDSELNRRWAVSG